MLMFLTYIIKSLLLIIYVILIIAFYTILERKIIAYIQRRTSPHLVGLFGLLQAIADGLKLLVKKTIIPQTANIIILLMSLEIMYLAANLNFAFYTFLSDDIIGVIFIIYILTIVGVESCIGLSLISVYYIIHRDISINTMDLLRR